LDGRQDEGGYRRGRDGWGDRVAEVTRAARTAVVARRRPALVSRATVTSLGAEGLATSAAEGVTSTWCIVRLGFLSRLPGSRPTRPTSYERCLVVSRYALGRIRPKRRIRQVEREQSVHLGDPCPRHTRVWHASMDASAGRLKVVASGTSPRAQARAVLARCGLRGTDLTLDASAELCPLVGFGC
jgi:hypothetical protein